MSVTIRDDTPDIITETKGILGGQPRVAGTRISVLHIVDLVLHDKYTIDEVVHDIYPELTTGHVAAAIIHYLNNRTRMRRWEKRQQAVGEDMISGPKEMPSE